MIYIYKVYILRSKKSVKASCTASVVVVPKVTPALTRYDMLTFTQSRAGITSVVPQTKLRHIGEITIAISFANDDLCSAMETVPDVRIHYGLKTVSLQVSVTGTHKRSVHRS